MKKIKIQYLGFIVAVSLTACSSDDLPLTSPDAFTDADLIGFAKNVGVQTRGYEEYSDAKHPGTMGVFGYHDLCPAAVGKDAEEAEEYLIFSNVSQTAHNGTDFTYTIEGEKRYWPEFSWAANFDFFGYMPHVASGAKVVNTPATNDYTLSFPVDLSGDKGVITDTKKAPLICAEPIHKSVSGEKVTFKMDQTLLKYEVKFRLGDKMDAIREFTIKKVELDLLQGNIPVRGTVSRTYTYNKDNTPVWTPGNVEWSDIVTADGTEPVLVKDNIGLQLNNNTAGYQTACAFYAIPTRDLVLRVTYDVNVDNGGNEEMTRKEIVSTIALTSTNFPSFNPAIVGEYNGAEFDVLIVPTYLYTLADGDHTFGIVIKQ